MTNDFNYVQPIAEIGISRAAQKGGCSPAQRPPLCGINCRRRAPECLATTSLHLDKGENVSLAGHDVYLVVLVGTHSAANNRVAIVGKREGRDILAPKSSLGVRHETPPRRSVLHEPTISQWPPLRGPTRRSKLRLTRDATAALTVSLFMPNDAASSLNVNSPLADNASNTRPTETGMEPRISGRIPVGFRSGSGRAGQRHFRSSATRP